MKNEIMIKIDNNIWMKYNKETLYYKWMGYN